MLDTCRKLTGKFWVVVVRMGYSTKPKGFVVVLPAQIGKVWGFAGAWWVGFSCVKIGWPKSHGLQLITVSSLGTLQLEPVNARNDQWRSVNFAVPPPYHHISPYHRRDVWSEGQFPHSGVIENRPNGNHRFCFQQGFLQTFPSNWFWTLGRPSVWTGTEDRRKGCQGLDLQTFLFWLWIYLLTLRIFASRYKDLRQWYQLTFIFLEWAATTSQLRFTPLSIDNGFSVYTWTRP
jgi:hypothetical protein